MHIQPSPVHRGLTPFGLQQCNCSGIKKRCSIKRHQTFKKVFSFFRIGIQLIGTLKSHVDYYTVTPTCTINYQVSKCSNSMPFISKRLTIIKKV